MRLVMHHRARQGVIAHHVREVLCLRILHHETVDDAILRREPMRELLLRENRRQVEFTEVLRNKEDENNTGFCS